MSGAVKVAEKLDWGCGPYFKIFYVCGHCRGAYNSEKELISHKIKVHLDSEQRKRLFQNQKKQQKHSSKLDGDGQTKNQKSDMGTANNKSDETKRMKTKEPKSLKKEPIEEIEILEDEEEEEERSDSGRLRRSSRSRKRKPTAFIAWEDEVLWEAKEKKQERRNKENMKRKSRKLDSDQWSVSSSGSVSTSASASGSRPKLTFENFSSFPERHYNSSSVQVKKDAESGSYFPCSFCKTSYRMISYRDKHEREAHGGAYIRK